MKASDFKSEIKKLKNNLRGLTLQLVTSNSVTPFNTPKSFGNMILQEEQKGSSFRISQVWTSEGIIKITSIKELTKLFVTNTITGIQFKSFFIEPTDCLKYSIGRLD